MEDNKPKILIFDETPTGAETAAYIKHLADEQGPLFEVVENSQLSEELKEEIYRKTLTKEELVAVSLRKLANKVDFIRSLTQQDVSNHWLQTTALIRCQKWLEKRYVWPAGLKQHFHPTLTQVACITSNWGYWNA